MRGLVGALCAALAVIAATGHPLAQSWTCAAIRTGETTASVARRLTGDARNRFEPWFQILDPATSRFVRKEDYDPVHARWRACVMAGRPHGDERRGFASSSTLGGVLDTLARAIGRVDSRLALWAALALAIALTWSSLDEYLTDRNVMLAAMQRFGEAFVLEFERSLVQRDDPAPPIRSRLRANARRRRLEILIAPGGRRRYPNLSDHKKNVEYDVARVLQRVRDRSFVGGPLHADGQWVVVPFEFQGPSRQAGVK
jgi:hypothetical protein